MAFLHWAFFGSLAVLVGVAPVVYENTSPRALLQRSQCHSLLADRKLKPRCPRLRDIASLSTCDSHSVQSPGLLLVLPSTSGYFMRIRSPYRRVVLVVSVPAKSRSATVTAMFSKVYIGSALCFSCG